MVVCHKLCGRTVDWRVESPRKGRGCKHEQTISLSAEIHFMQVQTNERTKRYIRRMEYQKQKGRQLQHDLILQGATTWSHPPPSLQVRQLEPIVWQNGWCHATITQSRFFYGNASPGIHEGQSMVNSIGILHICTSPPVGTPK